MASTPNVLRVNRVEEEAAYEGAVSEILRRILADYETTLLEIAEKIDVSLGTISNAFNKKAVLNPIYLKRLGQVYGVQALDPYVALVGGRVVPIAPEGEADVLPVITLATHRIVSARAPDSPGGVVETLREQLDYLPELRRLQREVDALICRIERRRAAA